jgi:hypothetical protein
MSLASVVPGSFCASDFKVVSGAEIVVPEELSAS